MNNSNVKMAFHSPRRAKLLIFFFTRRRCLISSAQYYLRTLTIRMLTNIGQALLHKHFREVHCLNTRKYFVERK